MTTPRQRESGESVPQPDPTRLTTEALLREVAHAREINDLRFEQLDLRLQQRFDAQQKAIDAALVSADLKIEALADQVSQLALDTKANISRSEYQVQHSAVTERIDELRARYFEQYGAAQASPTTADQMIKMQDKVETLLAFRDTSTGRGVGANALWGYMVGGVGFVIGLALFVIQVTGG